MTSTRGTIAGVPADVLIEGAVGRLRRSGARFAFLHGSRATGAARHGSDVDLAAWWPEPAPAAFEIELPEGVDLLVLNHAPLELAGRVALEGRLVLDDDPGERVRWLATTRKIYSDERPRLERAHQEFLESRARG